ncbi:acyl carrier protein [Kitasatospora sp. LaBMicrA B282]|uniref:acyl carrier protein n=1 Tax=Kitasatospora sp. LaBMicrA B282 TaxID=3420949 RepID=UPI003D12CE9D
MTAPRTSAADRPRTDDLLELSKKTLIVDLGVDEARIVPGASMTDMGIDSVCLIELKVMLQRLLGIRIPVELLAFDDTLERFVKKVSDCME